MDITTLYRAMAAKVVIAIQSEALIHHAKDTPDNVIANRESLGNFSRDFLFFLSFYSISIDDTVFPLPMDPLIGCKC